ncbi:TonB-linked SusC/RagA family outer membrane protein [Chitinophaga terrae (ex Kim and Jung 2007)]|uniref:SusC/RagA family TonB-linked outer membrane protein n=1 Tax=Chitinophaga terrae (ex Kim and Jung 2007) TaxID=408074 RepID=UPI00278AE7CA|nr:TonB-dependent receptor [Chitinophaga terrae (ex Kim and Jung 2007)]MDQ0108781.1 TonB-linked SusC/RagA family outer membrane protein [Chitinophaga terrae (ex Kim and Jung 2007)]
MKRLLLLMLLASGLFQAYAQKQLTKGKVSDETGQPLPGATVRVKGTTISTSTDGKGEFQISTGDQTSPVLIISYIGYNAQEIPVSGNGPIAVQMQLDAKSLQDVVVVGYGVQKKRDVTGATSSLKAVDIAKRPLTRIEQALQGTTAGVTAQSNSGQPGKGLSIRVRGTSSISGGNDPLYVIDGYIGGNIESVSMADIESMEILKDASATAIYGSRGSNGVVLITTKSGKSGKMKVDASAWFSKASLPKKLDLLNAFEFATQANKQAEQNNTTKPYSQADLDALAKNPKGTDWQDEVTQQPLIQNYQVSVSGGSENIKYYLSYNNIDQPGLAINQWYKRNTLRANVDAQLNKKLNLKVNITAVLPQSRNVNYAGDITDPFAQAYQWAPTATVRDENGNFVKRYPRGSNQFNPVANALNRQEDGTTTNVTATGILTYQILKNLTFTSNNSYELQNQLTQTLLPKLTNEGDVGQDRASQENSRYRSWQNSNFLTYNNRFGDHSLTVTALFEQASRVNNNFKAQANNLSSYGNGYYNLGLGRTQLTTSGYWADALISYMGRVNYSYKDKYLLTASVRTDGSSHLTEKYSTFPAIALGWAIDKEGFMPASNVLTGLKLRLSYGQTGNQAVPAYSTIARVTSGGPAYYFDGSTPSVSTPLGTPVARGLKWERNTTYDAGLDAEFFKGRLTFVFDAYDRKITDLLYDYPVDEYKGGGNYKANIGTLRNRGLEFNVGGTPVIAGKFKWNANFNISFNDNKVVDLGGLDKQAVNNIGSAQHNASILQVGESLGSFYGWEFLGTWKTAEKAEAAKYGKVPGDAKYLDVNNDGQINDDDRKIIGCGIPKYTFGFGSDFTYGNWSLNVLFQGSHGNQIMSATFPYTIGNLGDARDATSHLVDNMWSPEKETDVPTYTSKNDLNTSRWVYDASFIKLKNIGLTYTFPESLLSRVKFRSLDIFVSAQNIWTITNYPGYDPEVTNSTNAITQGLETGVIPNPKTYTIGLRLGL